MIADPTEAAMFACADTLTLALSDAMGCECEHIAHTLCTVPDNMLGLLDSPEGWTALASFVGGSLGLPSLYYKPTVH